MNAVLSLPAIPDLQAGLGFLSRLPLANPVQAVPALQQFFISLIRHPLPAKPMLELLEETRLPLAAVLEVHARRFLNHALPFGEIEERAFHETCATWRLIARAYTRCAKRVSSDESDASDRLAVILHRCMYYTGLLMHEHFRARRELPPELWLNLYAYYAKAEDWRMAERPVSDPVEPAQQSTHCTAALVTILLTELAGHYRLSPKEIGLVRRWAMLWSPLVSVFPASTDIDQSRYVINLAHTGGLKPAPLAAASADRRCLDISRLEIQLKQVRLQLKQRVPPSGLGLGQDVSSGQCQELLATLDGRWRQADSPRRYRRRPAAGTAQVAVGFEAIHYLVSGREFRQPENVRQYSRAEFEALYAFRHRLNPNDPLHFKRQELKVPIDSWLVLDHSPAGFRLERSAVGQKMVCGQLVCAQPPDGDRYLLAKITWLMQSLGGGLAAGIGLLPGSPTAIAVRATGFGISFTEPYTRAFLLPEVAAMGTPSSLVLPQGWFHTGRVVEVQNDVVWLAKLTALIEKGSDFERVSYALCG